MRKNYIFLRMFAMLFSFLGMTLFVDAASVKDLKTIETTRVFAFGDYVSDGTGSRTSEGLFDNDFFFDCAGGSVATNKGSIDISNTSSCTILNEADDEYLSETYKTYGSRLNCLRLKTNQNVIALKPKGGSVIYLFGSGNNSEGTTARIPKFATDVNMKNALNEAPGADHPKISNYVCKFEVPETFDGKTPLYIGTYNGDAYFSYIIVECPELPALFEITVNSNPEKGGEVSIQNRVSSEDKTSENVTLLASPNTNYAFKEWQDAEGNVLSTANPYEFTATEATTINAVFVVDYAERSPDSNPEKNIAIEGISYTIDGTYNPSGLGAAYGNMFQSGVKLRTGQHGSTIRFDVNEGYVITGISFSMYANDEGLIRVISASVDGVELKDFEAVNLPSNTDKKAVDIELKNISAKESVVLGFDNSGKVANNQIFTTYIVHYAHQLVINDEDNDEGVYPNFNPEYSEYVGAAYKRELGDHKYGFICLPFAPDAESLEHFQFYTLSSVDETEQAVTFTEVDAPEANKPYLYGIKDGATRTSTITGGAVTIDLDYATAVESATAGTWELVGSLVNEEINCEADATVWNYALNRAQSTLHKITKTLTVYPYTAYLRNNVSNAQNLLQMRIRISGPTGIKEISRDQVEGLDGKNGMFDLQGRSISRPVKGQVYIENGEKKVKN